MKTTVKRILNDCGSINYPTGSHSITDMVEAITKMADEIKLLYKPSQKLNLCCRGSSGAIIAGIVLYQLNIDGRRVRISHVKKPGEYSHDNSIHLRNDEKIIIIDDFITTGKTINAIHDKLVNLHQVFEIDLLIVMGNVDIDRLEFQPNNIICSRVQGRQFDINIIH